MQNSAIVKRFVCPAATLAASCLQDIAQKKPAAP